MSYENFKDIVFSTVPSNMVFHFNKHGLIINAIVQNVEPYHIDAGIHVHFVGGNFHVLKDNEITECLRPANLLVKCEKCFSLKNEYKEHIGYLYIGE